MSAAAQVRAGITLTEMADGVPLPAIPRDQQGCYRCPCSPRRTRWGVGITDGICCLRCNRWYDRQRTASARSES